MTTPPPLIVDDLRKQLSMEVFSTAGRTGSTIEDDILQDYVSAALDLAVDFIGYVVPTSLTETHDGGGQAICLRSWPILSVEAVSEAYSGAPTSLAAVQPGAGNGYLVDLDAAVVLRSWGAGSYGTFLGGPQAITVTYTAGRSAVPAAVMLGLKMLAAHLYGSRIGQTSSRPNGVGSGPSTAYAIPYRVLELWRPYMRPPGIA